MNTNDTFVSWSSLWAATFSQHSPEMVEVIGTHLIQFIFFWTLSLFLVSLEFFYPTFSQKHKLQPAEKQPSTADIVECLHIVGRNQMLASSLHGLLSYLHHRSGKPAQYRYIGLPSPQEVVRDLVLCVLIREVLFYYSHRLLHIPHLYPHVHKFHHRFVAPVALAAQYAHPIEHFISNILPLSVPPALLRVHLLTWWIFLALELIETTTVHSGYDFFKWAKMHDTHHEKFRVNFGTIGLMDWLHGTREINNPKPEVKAS